MWQADAFIPWFLVNFVNPMLSGQLMLPLADAYLSLRNLLATQWEATLRSNQPNAYRTRLEALRSHQSANAAYDSRPASLLIGDFPALEDRAIRVEGKRMLGTSPRRIELREYTEEFVLPSLREELARNRQLFEGCKLDDLPVLATRIPDLGNGYISRPGMLLDAKQREAQIPALLTGFLTVELLDHGWHVDRENWSLLALQSEERTIVPQQVVQGIVSKTISAADFEKLVHHSPTPTSTLLSPADPHTPTRAT